MVGSSGSHPTLSRSADHLGTLAATLRDLGGPQSVLNELTQNADDAVGESGHATTIRFTATRAHLEVWNDGTFSDCGAQLEGPECPWNRDGGASCDLHAFRLFAGRNKSRDPGKTGAFGVGFTSVYQLTDHPELLTGEWHWILDESADEKDRIGNCESGQCGRPHGRPGTTFVLPWAYEQTGLRTGLGVPTVSDETISALEDVLETPEDVLLFLHRVRSIETITSTGRRTHVRIDQELGPVISDGTKSTSWLVVSAPLGPQADGLIRESHGLIETDRPRDVSVAIPLDAELKLGVLYAGLPTQSPSGFSGHINASFFPKTDRKGVRFDSDPESEWNRLAVRTAANLLATKADVVLNAIGPKRFWELLVKLEKLERQSGNVDGEAAFREFWVALANVVPSLPAIETVGGARVTPPRALLPRSVDIYRHAKVLDGLGLHIVGEELNALVQETSFSKLGVSVLAPRDLVQQLESIGITEPFLLGEGPLMSDEVVSVLQTLELLGAVTNLRNVPGIARVAIIPCRGGWVSPASSTVVAADEEAALFELVDPDLRIVDEHRLNELCPRLIDSCGHLTLARAAEILHDQEGTAIQGLSLDILEWLDGRSGQLDEATVAKFAALPIFPSSDGAYHPLTDLSLRSGFKDPLGIAELVDDVVVRGHKDLLRKLGATELDVVEYLQRHVIPRAKNKTLPLEKARGVLDVISESWSRIDEADLDLSQIEIVPCLDGTLRKPVEVYHDSPDIRLLAPEGPFADTASFPAHLIYALSRLGVATSPTPETIVAAAIRLSQTGGDPEPKVAEAILKAAHNVQDTSTQLDELRPLAHYEWLPVKGGGSASPSAVLPTNQRQLYGRQAFELGLPAGVQNEYFRTLVWLGMPSTPSTDIVTRHLKDCVEHRQPVHHQVYEFLSRVADSPQVKALRHVACIQLSKPGTFAHPAAVFWQPTTFGSWAHQLPADRRPQQNFFDAVGVKESPGPFEIMSILDTIASEFGNDQLDESGQAAVHACWTALAEGVGAPETAEVLRALRSKRSMLDTRGILICPDRLYFRDSQGISDEFSLLSHEVIRREKATWRALAAAGVGRAEELFTIEPHNLDAQPDHVLTSVLSERRDALSRVLEGHADFEGKPLDLGVLDDIEVLVTGDLQVQYRAKLFFRVQITEPRSIDAVYLRDKHRLLHRHGCRPRNLARELARALDQDGDTAFLAMAIEQVIAADSLDDAHDALSDYGVADLITVERVEESSGTIESAEETDTDVDVEHEDEPYDHHVDHAATASGIHGAARAPRGPAQDGGDEEGSGGGHRPRQQSHQARHQRDGRQERLRSYVVFSGDDGDRGTVGDEAVDRSATDAAGIRRVLAYERSSGRTADEKSHENPGFDIESLDKSGTLVRRIEVKSTAAEWSIMGVMLSQRQMEQARKDGGIFWLYVVEYAEDDERARILRIHDPASRVSYFGFDGGWRAVAEPDLERDESGTPEAPNTRRFLEHSPGQSAN